MQDSQPDSALQLAMYRKMLTIRRFEERCNYLFMQGKIPSTLHLYIGQEAVAVGVCAHLTTADYATSHAPAARPRDRQGRDHPLDHGRAVRQAHRLLQGQGRLDARGRHDRRHDPRHRHRRRQHPADDGAGAGVQAAGEPAASPCPSWAMARRTRARSTRASTWPRSGTCRPCSSSKTTSTPPRRPSA